MLSQLDFANNLILVFNTLLIYHFYRFTISSVRSGASALCYFLVLAAAISNCIDRIVHNAVSDFIDFYPGGVNSIVVFNTADIMIFVGIIWLLFARLTSR